MQFPPHLSEATAQQVHFIFEWLGVLLGVQVYRYIKRRKQQESIMQGATFTVVIGCVLGAGIGNKLMFVLESPQLWIDNGWQSLLQGQSIVGGLLGGLAGVEITKKLNGIHYSTGDDFVLPLIVGTVVGRVGCFLAGLHDGTFGLPTSMAWGLDFGDGIFRHPTQLYDMVAVSVLGLLLSLNQNRLAKVSGLSFKLYLAGYLLWRLVIDGLKPVPYAYWLELSGIQWACVLALLLYLPLVGRDLLRLKNA
jgi:prolipoprotein diacylglyceryltransferase